MGFRASLRAERAVLCVRSHTQSQGTGPASLAHEGAPRAVSALRGTDHTGQEVTSPADRVPVRPMAGSGTPSRPRPALPGRAFRPESSLSDGGRDHPRRHADQLGRETHCVISETHWPGWSLSPRFHRPCTDPERQSPDALSRGRPPPCRSPKCRPRGREAGPLGFCRVSSCSQGRFRPQGRGAFLSGGHCAGSSAKSLL